MELENIVDGKRVLFITTHRIDYIRNTQELLILNKHAKSVDILYGKHNNHILSAFKVIPCVWFSSLDKYDVIMVSYMCQMVIPFITSKIKNKTLIVDFFISLYDAMVFDRQKFKKNSVFAKLAYWLDCKSLKYADLVIADTKTHAKYFKSEFKLDDKDIQVLYLDADKKVYHPMHVEKEEKLKKKYLVLYFGTVIPLQGFDIVMDAIKKLVENTNIYFIIIGPVATLYDKVETPNVTYIDWLSQNELAKYIAMADLCLAGHFNNHIEKANRTIPGKAYIYEAMDKKMILGDSEANHELFKEDNNHRFVMRGSGEELAKKILECSQE